MQVLQRFVTLLRRRLSWPPQDFSAMSLVEQQTFFKEANLDKTGSQFQYSKVRALLVKTLTKKKITQRMLDVGGTYLPLSVYRHRGYELPANFHESVPSQWSEPLKQYVYLLPEVSVRERDLEETVESQILQSERSIKKRKNAVANGSEAAEGQGQSMVLDLVTESEDDIEEVKTESKKAKTEKQKKADEKKEQIKEDKKKAAEQKKAQAKEQREAAANNRRIASLASKTVPALNAVVKKAQSMAQQFLDNAGSAEDPQLVNLNAEMATADSWRKAASQALQQQAKCSGAMLQQLPYDNEKEANQLIKNVTTQINALQLMVRDAKGKGKRARAAAKAAPAP